MHAALIVAILFASSGRFCAQEEQQLLTNSIQTVRHSFFISLNKNYSGDVTQNVSATYNFQWPSRSTKLMPFRLVLSAPTAHRRNWPLVAVVKQRSSVLTLTLPYLFVQHTDSSPDSSHVAQVHYHSLARTLCPTEVTRHSVSDALLYDKLDNMATVELSTSSVEPIHFTILGTLVENFTLTLDNSQTVHLRPSTPQYYFFNFSANKAGLSAVRVVARTEPDSEDSNVCLVMAIHRGDCPAGDTPENVDHIGLYQTVLSLGDIYVSKEEYTTFFVVLLSYPSTEKCNGSFDYFSLPDGLPFYNSTKRLEITVTPAPEPDALLLIFTVLILCAASLAIIITTVCAFRRFPQQINADDQQLEIVDTEEESAREPLLGLAVTMSVAVLNKKSADRHGYCLQLFVISVFYCLPVVQLMFVLSNNIYNSGNLDKCFYNYACSARLRITNRFEIYSFNSIFSNIGYLVAGVTFIIVCRIKKAFTAEACQTGVPDCYSLYYACGAAIFMEGVLSATYHLCPSYNNFQFDTAFMLLIAGLLILLLYSKRHPDANVTAQVAYLALGVFILANTMGILVSQYNALAPYLVLAVLHILLTVKLVFEIYFLGKVSSIREMIRIIFTRASPRDFPYPPDCRPTGFIARLVCCCRQPRYRKTLVFLIIGVALNLALICLYVVHGFGNLTSLIPFKFAGTFLAVLIINFLFYLTFYLLMKACTVRRSEWRHVCFILLLVIVSAGFSGFALHFFNNAPTDWTKSPAKSRTRNTDCILLGLFDKHDVWHFLSAGALFCLLMLIFFIDDNDRHKPRDKLPVF